MEGAAQILTFLTRRTSAHQRIAQPSILRRLSGEDSGPRRSLRSAKKADLPHPSQRWRFEGETNDRELVLGARR